MARFQFEPAIIEHSSSALFEACITAAIPVIDKINGDAGPLKFSANTDEDFWLDPDDWRATYRPYVVRDGVLRIPVKGALLNDFPWQLGSWATGYDYILAAMKRGMGDSAVKGIALVIDSPGGMVAGNFDLVDRMFAMRGKKPIKAYAMEYAYSAAYSIASVADSITVSRSGGVGSVGVVTMHIDVSERMNQAGYKVTFIFAGKHKVDGNAYEPLPEDVKARIQSRIDATYNEFASIVARNRGLTEAEVKATEAMCYSPTEALDVKFADAIGSLDDEITAFAATLKNEDENMAEQSQGPTYTAEDVARAKTDGIAEGMTNAQVRFNTILGSDAAKVRPKAALSMALKSKDTAEDVIATLSELAEEAAAPVAPTSAGAPAGMFNAAMDASNPATVSAGAETDAGDKVAARRELIKSQSMRGFK
jgi:signal peptide peptidase SppA